ncbi:Aspartyl protease family protein [Actinidia chinensis var. chinensis]|uniref:Aspartyl protease family protein n=1 Tax=Actinidia chinensis var. chinensis TaxID=1590841 RepID=A0A2R6Q2G7_ACTCC|nr:Aspartyl protease family protein [Actinidia chinensis var. chinensis]
MATQISVSFLFSSLFIFSLCSSNKGYALGGGERETLESHSHTVRISSLLPASVCSPSIEGNSSKRGSLKVVHKNGPCSHLSPDKSATPTATQILTRDQSRVNSIQYRLSFSSTQNLLQGKRTKLPANSGRSLGSGNYIVTIGLGTPKKDLSLIFDTGSDLTWTQCQPCVKFCYDQQEPILDPSLSTTYKNVSCNSVQCNKLSSATGHSSGCSGTTCLYGIQYGDSSFSVGYFGTETLTLTPTDVFPNFLFGCGQNNQGLFGSTAGLLGLGRDPLSVVSQTASKYGKYFSYCLPTPSGSNGYLTFGKESSSSLKFTTISINSRGPSFYFIDIMAIKVGGQTLSISQSVFKTAGTIIDSGTVITRLPPAAYSALRAAFRQQMPYPMAAAMSLLDTCYDLSKYTTVNVPTISFVFGGNVVVPIVAKGILYGSRASQLCLAFAGNSDASDVGILGNVQQQTLAVVYDVSGGKLGFGKGGCS